VITLNLIIIYEIFYNVEHILQFKKKKNYCLEVENLRLIDILKIYTSFHINPYLTNVENRVSS
jgi:hypothetical protein